MKDLLYESIWWFISWWYEFTRYIVRNMTLIVESRRTYVQILAFLPDQKPMPGTMLKKHLKILSFKSVRWEQKEKICNKSSTFEC